MVFKFKKKQPFFLGSRGGDRERRKDESWSLSSKQQNQNLLTFISHPKLITDYILAKLKGSYLEIWCISVPKVSLLIPWIMRVWLSHSRRKQATLAQLHALMQVATLKRNCLGTSVVFRLNGGQDEFRSSQPKGRGHLPGFTGGQQAFYHVCLSTVTDCPTLWLS